MSKIKEISCHKIINSRGDWTIETKVELDDGSDGFQAVPEGASKGENEAVGLEAEKAVEIVNTVINDALKGEDAFEQEALDNVMITMDDTPNKSRLGGNSLLSVSLALSKAAAKSKELELFDYLGFLYWGKKVDSKTFSFPTPVFNIINGGKHANNGLSFQEFMIIPASQMPYPKKLEMGVEIYHILERNLLESGYDVDVGDEGGFAPNNLTVRKALDFIRNSSSEKYKVGTDVFFGMDVAAESFHDKDIYKIPEEDLVMTSLQLKEYHEDLFKNYEIIYFEDPYYERDYEGWEQLTKDNGEKIMIVADDLVVTNVKFLEKAISKKQANAVIVKPNQVGTLTETLNFIRMAKEAGFKIIVSHRSGDTAEDTFISDLAYATGAEFLKAGALVRGERVAKYNRLLDIYDNIY